MSEQIVSLKKDIEIHKQVENELAKRSHFCQKVIKKLQEKIKTLKSERDEAKAGSKSNKKDDAKKKNQEELIHFLESKIDEIEKKLHTTQKEYEAL